MRISIRRLVLQFSQIRGATVGLFIYGYLFPSLALVGNRNNDVLYKRLRGGHLAGHTTLVSLESEHLKLHLYSPDASSFGFFVGSVLVARLLYTNLV